jgi:hypothetical protein
MTTNAPLRSLLAKALPLLLLASFVSLPSGCSKKKSEETGQEISKNPIQAAGQVADALKKSQEKMAEAAKRPPVDPVKFDLLLPFLPQPPAGWEADEAQGETTAMGEFKITVVNRTYRQKVAEGKGETAKSVELQITDGGFVPAVYAPFYMLAQFSHESTSGYDKGLTLDGNPAVEKWEKESKRSELTVLVADRFLVHFTEDRSEAGALRDWQKKIDVAKLAALANAGAK